MRLLYVLVREVGFQKHFDKTQGGRDGKRFPQRETLDKPGWSARRGTGEQAAQTMDTTRIINNNGTLSLRRNCEQWLGE